MPNPDPAKDPLDRATLILLGHMPDGPTATVTARYPTVDWWAARERKFSQWREHMRRAIRSLTPDEVSKILTQD